MNQKKIYRQILINREKGKKMLAVLIDPEKNDLRNLASIVAILKTCPPDFIFVGGSHGVHSTDSIIQIIKEEIDTSVVLFPGDASQFSEHADALLYLSLLSGRNPEYLIGQHIKSSLAIKQSDIEVIPTAYLLIDGGKISSVEYVSNTKSIPRDKKEIVCSTAVAGELLGMHLTYLDAGSGANYPVPTEIISHVRSMTSTPLAVGGGIRSTTAIEAAFNAGADLVVVGNIFESEPDKMTEFVRWTASYNDGNPSKISGRLTHPDIIY